MPLGEVGMVAAGGGVGKTMALTQLALAVATGRPWLAGGDGEGGLLTPDGGGRVLLALAEEDSEEMHRRLYGAAELMRETAGLTDEDLELARERVVVLPLVGEPVTLVTADPQSRDIAQSDGARELLRLLLQGDPWALVILDPLSRFAGLDTETDNAMATRFVQVVERLTKAPGSPTVLVAHHTNKVARQTGTRDGTGARGASGLTDAVRWVAELTSEKAPGDEGAPPIQMAVLEVTKSNYAPPLDAPLWLARENTGALRAATGDEVESFAEAREAAKERAKGTARKGRSAALRDEVTKILARHPGPLSKAAIAERLGASVNTMGVILAELEDEGLVERLGERGGWRCSKKSTS